MVSQSFNVYSTGFGVLQLFIIASLGFFFFKKKIIKKEGCRLLSSLLLWIFFPALIFSRITETFDPTTYPWWWLLPCCAIVMSFCGMFIGLVISTMLPQNNFKREFILSSGFQNCGYLPMALITFIYSGMLCDTILAHIILFVTGFNICIWMFAPAFLSQNDKKSFIISGIFRPPVISVIVSILLVLVFGKGCVSESILFPMRIIGNCSFTLGLLLLGAQLAQYRGYNIHNSIMTTGCLIAKLIILPALVLCVILVLPCNNLYKFVIFLQSTMPTAVTLVIIGMGTKEGNLFFSSIILYSHLFAIITVPLWLALFNSIISQ